MIKKILLLVFAGIFSVFTYCQNFKILTWNIFMIPPTIFKSCQDERCVLISNAVKQWDADVIIFQEAFQKKSRNTIWQLIKDKYPYESGVPKSGFLKTHSGVWIVSKYPIEKKEMITYKVKKGSDKLAKKGATFVEINVNGKKVQVIGTHVQSDGKYQAIRDIQFKQLIDELGNKYFDPTIPQFIGGDLNTDKKFEDLYREMLRILDSEEVSHTGEPFSWNGTENNLGAKFFGKHQETLDYILIRRGNKNVASIKKEIILSAIAPSPFCKKNFNGMSDHYPVMAEIELN